MSILQSVLGFLGGGVIRDLRDGLLEAQRNALAAETDERRLQAQQQIAFYEGQLQLAIAASQSDKWWSTRELIGKCVLIYVAKIVVWDTVLQLGVTPDPGPVVGGIVMVVIGFYYGSRAATDVASKLLAATVARR